MLLIQVKNLVSVELWKVVVLEHVQNALQSAIEQVPSDTALLVLLYLLSSRWCIICGRWYAEHVCMACLYLSELLIDDEAIDLLCK